MKIRAALLASMLAVGVVATQSSAAAKCFLIEDPKGDTFLVRNQEVPGVYGPQEDAMDLVSMDIATDAKNIAVAMRVVKLSKTASTSPYGQAYEFQFQIPGTENTLYLSGRTVNGADTFGVGYRDTTANLSASLGTATGKFDADRNTIFVSAPLSVFAGQGGIKPGTKITPTNITGSRNLVAVNVFADVVVPEGKTYTAGTATCINPSERF